MTPRPESWFHSGTTAREPGPGEPGPSGTGPGAVDFETPSSRPLIAAAFLVGVGMGGFVDGILFHQILQSHNMLSARLPPTTLANAEVNMFWDGLFHAFTWLATAAGLALLWRAVRRRDVPLSTRTFVGSLLMGWGVFNVVEGVLDHFVLQIHHVVERAGLSLWDFAFLAIGLALVVGGLLAIRSRTANALTGDP